MRGRLGCAWLCGLSALALAGPGGAAASGAPAASRAPAAGPSAAPAKESTPPGPAGLAGLWRRVHAALERAGRERLPTPPVPVHVTWHERRVGAIDLGAPLLAVRAVDLDRDGRAELAALTTREVVLFHIDARPRAGGARRLTLTELARAPLTGDPATLRPRDPVGTIAVDARGEKTELLVRSSELADGVALTYAEGALTAVRRITGFPLCPGGAADLVPGRNYFSGASARWEGAPPPPPPPPQGTTDLAPGGAAAGGSAGPLQLPESFFSAGCRDDVVDAQGRPLSITAVVDLDRVLHVRCRRGGGKDCPPGPASARDYDGTGVAFDVADIDNDGSPEVLTSRGGAPGDRDSVSVWSRRGPDVVKVYGVDFHAGVVAITAGDVDGDGDRDVVAAVRFAGSSRVSFWTLD